MTGSVAGGTLMIAGSAVFMVGAAVGVPGVFTERDPQRRLQMLQDRLRIWQFAQVPYAAGPVLAGVGVMLTGAAPGRESRSLFLAAGAALLVGTVPWAWDDYLRALRVRDFAYGKLQAWPFASYVLTTNVGLALLGVALLRGEFPLWIGWTTLTADLLFFVAYVTFRDIPPFVFYLLLPVIGGVVV